ncbi:LysR family transcriptional regulator [Serratia fonticola]|uniref:LysR substrate-binding domain-containing protein n=1 Tax=Serratia fonticola TaxID=47917 RepID=UPI0015C68FDB|nr:LysR substrate-binding domain-containing protein [Serratia fonticola]MBC3378338.1 LysR family transcriptional regulator [Serratia fonticola]NYA37538.1 LysR family transcriptional regulator [Serratia fonticola]
MIKLQQLKVFQVVADLGSIRAASVALNLTQPALTRSLKELESSLEVDLIIRGAGGITLTEPGTIFNVRVNQILRDIESARNEVRDVVKFRNRSISFGFSSSLTYTVLPKAIKRFQEYFPEITINLIEGQLTELLPKARTGELDFCISVISDNVSINDFFIDSFFSMPFYVIARKGNPLEKSLSMKDLANADWCLPSSSFGYQKQIESAIFDNKTSKTILRADSSETRFSMVLNTDYLTISPEAVFNDYLLKDNLVIINVKEKIPSALYCVMHQNKFPLSPGAKWLIDELRYSIRQSSHYWKDGED